MENFCKNASKTFQKRGKKISEKESFKQLIQICTENCVYTIFQQSLESQVRLRKAFLKRLKYGSFWLSCTGTEGTAVTVYSPMSVCVVTWSCVRPVWQPQRERGCAAARAEGDTPRCPRAAPGSEGRRGDKPGWGSCRGSGAGGSPSGKWCPPPAPAWAIGSSWCRERGRSGVTAPVPLADRHRPLVMTEGLRAWSCAGLTEPRFPCQVQSSL